MINQEKMNDEEYTNYLLSNYSTIVLNKKQENKNEEEKNPGCTHSWLFDYKEGQEVCTNCAVVGKNQIAIATPWMLAESYTEKMQYVRKHHFTERLNQLTGRYIVSNNVIEMFKQKWIQNKNEPLTKKKILKYARQLKLTKYSENWIYILCHLTQISLPTLSVDEFDLLSKWFVSAETTFIHMKQKKQHNMKNMLNTNFLLSKMFERIDRPDLLKWVPIVTTKSILKKQNDFFSKLEPYIDW